MLEVMLTMPWVELQALSKGLQL